MSKKEYISPKIITDITSNEMAAPLAMFSAATAAAGLAGIAIGAATTAKILGDDIHRRQMISNREIVGLCT